MSNNITLTLQVERESDLLPPGHTGEALFLPYRFQVTEQLSRTYLLRIRVAAYTDSLDLASLVGRSLVLTESRDLDDSGTVRSRDFKGVVWSAQQRGQNLGLGVYYYWLDVRPALQSLAMTTRSQVYGTDQARSIPEIINYCLTGSYGDTASTSGSSIKSSIVFATDYEHASSYKTSSMMKDFVVQYNETDLDFMQRQMERWGIFYFFNPYDESSFGINQVIVTDENGAFKYTGNASSISDIVTINYVQPNKYAPGTTYKVKNFIARHSLRSKTLTLDDYNYRAASTELSIERDLDSTAGEGTMTLFGENFRSTGGGGDGSLLAQRQSELIMSDQEFFTGQSDCFELIPGFIVALEGHFRWSYNSDTSANNIADLNGYLVTEVIHECAVPLPGQSWNDDDYGHTANFTALHGTTVYRPARVTPVPQMPGVISATVDSADDTGRADLDAEGRYLMWAKFDVSGLPDGKHSSRVRMAQPYGGKSGGFMFPMAKGIEVMLGFVNGDPDRPIVLGSAPNSSNPSPVATGTETRNRVVTDSAITLELEDAMPATSSETGRSVTAAPASIGRPVGAAASDGSGAAATGSDSGVGQGAATGQDQESATLNNWARLYMSHADQKSYLRLGGVPSDEASNQIASIDKHSLSAEAGWLDYTAGDRSSGTVGDVEEIVGGNEVVVIAEKQKIVVGDALPDAASLADATTIETTDAARTIFVAAEGADETIYGGHKIQVKSGDQLVEVADGMQHIGTGDYATIQRSIGGTPSATDQDLFSASDQYLYATDNQYLETGGDQVYEIHGDQIGTVDGRSDIKVKNDSTETYYGTKKEVFHGWLTDLFLGGSFEGSFAFRTAVYAAVSIELYASVQMEMALSAKFSTDFIYTQETFMLYNEQIFCKVKNQVLSVVEEETEIRNTKLGNFLGIMTFF